MKRILVINIARMGDLIQSSPLLEGLKRSAPEAEVTLLISDIFQDTAARLPGVDRMARLSLRAAAVPLFACDVSLLKSYALWRELATDLTRQPFDRIINITHSNYSAGLTALIAWRSAASGGGRPPEVTGLAVDRRGFRTVSGGWASYYFNSVLNRGFNRFNLVDIHSRIGGVAPSGRLFLNVSERDRQAADDILKGQQIGAPPSVPPRGAGGRDGVIPLRGAGGRARLVAVIPAASTKEKQYPAALFSAALNELRRQVEIIPVIFGTGKEAELGDEIVRQSPGTVNLCGKTEVGTLAALLERSALCISNDTGPMHIAAAVGTPVLDITLGSALAWETAPYGSGHIVVEPRLGCFPCLPRHRCPHFNCHSHIAPELVARLAAAMLKGEDIELEAGGRDLSPVNVYRTGFDDDGWWELTPLIRRPMTLDDLINAALRGMWKHSLNGEAAWSADYAPAAGKLGRRLVAIYDGRDALRPEQFLAELKTLAELAGRGLAAARRLAELGDGSAAAGLAARLGAELRAVDGELVRRAYGRADLMPLVAQFANGKDALTGTRLDELARQTARLYSDLMGWCRALPFWLEAWSGDGEASAVPGAAGRSLALAGDGG